MTLPAVQISREVHNHDPTHLITVEQPARCCRQHAIEWQGQNNKSHGRCAANRSIARTIVDLRLTSHRFSL
jgi:hypothetical protein